MNGLSTAGCGIPPVRHSCRGRAGLPSRDECSIQPQNPLNDGLSACRGNQSFGAAELGGLRMSDGIEALDCVDAEIGIGSGSGRAQCPARTISARQAHLS